MHKAMLSQSMGDKTQEEIVETRSRLSHRTGSRKELRT